MKRIVLTALAAAAFAGTGAAGEISQTIDINITPEGFMQEFTLHGFDTQGANRTLTGVRFQIQSDFNADFNVLNYSNFPIASGDWMALPGFSMFFTAEPTDGGDDFIFAGVGGISFDSLTGDLPAGSGGPFGEPGVLQFSDSGSLDSDFLDDSDTALSFFSQHQNINSTLSPFSFPEIFGPPGSNIVLESFVTQTGSLTVIYEFSEIPAPGAAGLLALAGLPGLRRRR